MSFLPVASRELRVAARKRSTFWLRMTAALVAVLFLAGFMIFALVMPAGMGRAGLGQGLFAVLSWTSLGAGLCAGLFFTSDALSEEKREATIGFLFLTDLRGYDVVLGKLLATSLRGFYAVLAIFPILAIVLLMGGVAGLQFWKASLALLNGIFASLSAGLFVSALCRNSQTALVGTLFLLLVWIIAGPIGDAMLVAAGTISSGPALSLSSPGYLLLLASSWGRAPFWYGLLVNQTIAWLLLGCACQLLPRLWQDSAKRTADDPKSWRYIWRFGTARSRERRRHRLMQSDPIAWLACREHWQTVLVWASALLMAAATAGLLAARKQAIWSTVWSSCSGVVLLLFYLGTASYVARFWVEAKRNGVLELLLISPMPVKQIVRGQWVGLARLFALPLCLCLAAEFAGSFLAQEIQWTNIKSLASSSTAAINTNSVSVTFPAPGSTNVTTFPVNSLSVPSRMVMLLGSLASSFTFAVNLVALAWFGMWMGLTTKTTNLATLKTLLFVQVAPWFVMSFGAGVAVSIFMFSFVFRGIGAANASFVTASWYPLIFSGVFVALSLAKDLGFSLWARRKLLREMRNRMVEQTAPPPILGPPHDPPRVPPVLGTTP